MTYRGTMPPASMYNGQSHPQHPQQPQLPQLPQHRQHPPYQQPLPQPLQLQPQYSHPFPNGSQQYQHVQYTQPAYPQRQPEPYYLPVPSAQFQTYDSPTYRPPPPASTAPPVQFIDPSSLQRAPAPRPTTYLPPASSPAPAVVSTPTPPPASAPAPAPTSAPAPAYQPQPVTTTIAPQQTRVPPKTPQPPSAKNSPRLDERRPPSQGSVGKPVTKDGRRLASGGAIAKSPIMSNQPHVETFPLLLCVAEDCFARANLGVQDVARNMTAEEVMEHHKLVATGLGCLEVALKSTKLSPRLEARVCLRYASILVDETTNLTDAEMALARGIAVCEKHRFIDLKYSSQFILIKTLFQRSPKAAFKSIDMHISDCATYKHIHWVYAFRFLKASFYLQSGTASENHALENLRKIASIAISRDDKAIFVMATLLEGLAHLSSRKDEWMTRVQTCIAQASKLQLDESVHLPQIDILLLLLDLACSLHQKATQLSSTKLNALQTRLEELKQSRDWATVSSEVLLPIKQITNVSSTISNDTRAILRPGEGGTDYLVLATLGKQEAFGLAYVLHGIVALHRATTPGRSSNIWGEAVRVLEEKKIAPTLQSLPEALRHSEWTKEIICYAHVLTGLQSATLSDWARVKSCLETIQEMQPPAGFLDIMILYLDGVFKQGTARLSEAMEVWKDPRFEIDWSGEPKHNKSQVESELSILAALNRLWIMEEPASKDEAEMADLVDQLGPLCDDNPDMEIRTAYHLVLASIQLSPPRAPSIQAVKRHIQVSLGGSQSTNNTQCLSMALNVMRCRLFENVVGEQAVKSAKAGLAQAKKSGNLLWMSVAEGMLAQSLEMQGALAEARASMEKGVELANEAFQRTQV